MNAQQKAIVVAIYIDLSRRLYRMQQQAVDPSGAFRSAADIIPGYELALQNMDSAAYSLDNVNGRRMPFDLRREALLADWDEALSFMQTRRR